MCLTEFDEKKYEDVLREEGQEEGLAEGLEKGLAKGRKTEVFVSVQEGDYGVLSAFFADIWWFQLHYEV